jgi:hypothetical protein
MTSTAFGSFRETAIQALRLHDDLHNIFSSSEESELVQGASMEDVTLLRELIIQRIYPENAFNLLVYIDKNAAIEILLSRYVGKFVDPDTKFGGYETELELMLDDLREVCGIEQIVRLVRHPQFAIDRIADPRVQRALGEALDIDDEQVPGWIYSQRGKSNPDSE